MDNQEKDVEEIACDLTFRFRSNYSERKEAIKDIAAALLKEREKVNKLVEIVKGVDPLLAKCDWENGDTIAYAVKKLIVSKLKQAIESVEGKT
jgi:hypothetical protein